MRMKRMFLTLTAMLLALTVSAQSAQKQQTFESFNGISVSGDFEVTLSPGTEYSVLLTVDQAILPYVQCFVNTGTLYISVGKLPKEVKKLFKGRKAPKPAYYATITTPTVGTVTLADNVSLIGTSTFTAKQFALTLSGKSQVRHLSIEDATNAQVTMSKSAIAELNVDADVCQATLAGSASLRLTYNVEQLQLAAKGSTTLVAGGATGTANVSGDNSAKITLNGTAEELLEVRSSGGSIDALNLQTRKAVITMNGGSLVESASDEIVVDLSGKSSVLFDHDPKITVVGIKTSSLQHYGNR